MKHKISWYHWLSLMLKEFIAESKQRPYLEIVNIYECQKTGFTKAVIKLSERHIIEKNISDVIVDNELIAGFDPKTIRALTYMATVERLKPDYSIVVQKMGHEIDDYVLELKSRNDGTKLEKSPSEISQDGQVLKVL